MIFIVVKHPVRPEYADGWVSLVEEFTVATRAEPGTICFDWFRSVDDRNVYLLVEAFRDGAAGQDLTEYGFGTAARLRRPGWPCTRGDQEMPDPALRSSLPMARCQTPDRYTLEGAVGLQL